MNNQIKVVFLKEIKETIKRQKIYSFNYSKYYDIYCYGICIDYSA